MSKQRVVSMLLALVLPFSSVPMQAHATAATETTEATEVARPEEWRW